MRLSISFELAFFDTAMAEEVGGGRVGENGVTKCDHKSRYPIQSPLTPEAGAPHYCWTRVRVPASHIVPTDAMLALAALSVGNAEVPDSPTSLLCTPLSQQGYLPEGRDEPSLLLGGSGIQAAKCSPWIPWNRGCYQMMRLKVLAP